jgi:hypothetical protein
MLEGFIEEGKYCYFINHEFRHKRLGLSGVKLEGSIREGELEATHTFLKNLHSYLRFVKKA